MLLTTDGTGKGCFTGLGTWERRGKGGKAAGRIPEERRKTGSYAEGGRKGKVGLCQYGK